MLPRVENVIAWRSLLYRELRLHSLAIEAPRLRCAATPPARCTSPASSSAAEPGDGRGADWLLAQSEIVVRDAEIEWRDEKRGAPPLALTALNLRLRNSGDEHADRPHRAAAGASSARASSCAPSSAGARSTT